MKRTTVDLWVGVFVTAGLISLLTLALKVGNATSVSAADSYTVVAQFTNIGGLKPRAFDDQNFLGKVTLHIDKRYKFPKDTSASILTSGLLGEQYVGLDAGADAVNLKDGDQIKLTQSAVVLEKLIGQFLYGKAAEGGEKK